MNGGTRPGQVGAITTLDLGILADSYAVNNPSSAIFGSVDAIAQHTVGHRMLTVMRLHQDTMELERLYSTSPAYPIGARKSKKGLPWSAHVLVQREVYC